METVTLLISVLVGGLVVFFLSPLFGLLAYMGVLVWYPSYLTFSVGGVDFTVSRFVILMLYVRLFLQSNVLSRFRFLFVDKLIIVYFLCQITAESFSRGLSLDFIQPCIFRHLDRGPYCVAN